MTYSAGSIEDCCKEQGVLDYSKAGTAKLTMNRGFPRMTQTSRIRKIRAIRGSSSIVFLLALGLLEYLFFSDSFSYFFQGDALFYMSHRFRTWGEFFHALYSLDIANWYRPLASQTIPSIFFPWF